MAEVRSPLRGSVVRVVAAPGAIVEPSSPVVIVESMKMEYVVEAGAGGTIGKVVVAPGDAVTTGDLLAVVEEAVTAPAGTPAAEPPGSQPAGTAAPGGGAQPAHADAGPTPRADLAEVAERHGVGLDDARPEAVARRRNTGQRTARENVADLVDPGSFVEYGPLVIAAQRRRRSLDDLIARTPADGLVAGVGTVDGRPTAVLSYDYTVLAGTQGYQNHRKKDRLFDVIERQALPVVFFAEGGGGRPGDSDAPGVSGLDCLAFNLWGRLSGRVPLVGITSGRCFAGNAAILGCCDVVIATAGSNIGMGGPAMIEGGGLGVFAPEAVGPLELQVGNGVVDVPVADEAEAVAVAKRYLSYFGGRADEPARVINVGSIDGIRVPLMENYSYSASKAAVHMLTRHLAKRLAPTVTVNAIAPGPFESKMMAATLDAFGEQIVAGTPLKRIGRPDDMAGAAIYLASRAGAYLTGAVIPVDGGIASLA
jgi:NAD(P)-dependent dehydrogenase (short-subunit alcohol dehydrogenase family)